MKVGVADLPAVLLEIVPAVSDLERPYWTGGSEGLLLVSRCSSCGNWSHPPFPRCPACHSTEVVATPVSGRGTVYSFTINVHPWAPAMVVPYVIAVVELAEQETLHLYTNLVDVAPEDVRIGMPVTATFAHVHDVWIPVFRPVEAA